jgi:hypothetical protein
MSAHVNPTKTVIPKNQSHRQSVVNFDVIEGVHINFSYPHIVVAVEAENLVGVHLFLNFLFERVFLGAGEAVAVCW